MVINIHSIPRRVILYNLFLSQAVFIIIFLLCAPFVYASKSEFFSLLSINNITDWFVIFSVTAIVLVFNWAIATWLPEEYIQDDGLNERIFAEGTYVEIICISAFVAISEELLFRGILQLQFGFVVASIIFALLHFRYLKKFVLFLSVMIVSFILGFVFMKTESLIITIIIHFLVDSLLGIYLKYQAYQKRGQRGGESEEC